MKKYMTILAIVSVLAVSACCHKDKEEKLHFASDSYALTKHDKHELDKVAKNLKANSSEKVKVYGYADATGTSEHNMTLSQERAGAASDYLVAKGIKSSRIKTVAYGDSDPIATNMTKKGRKENRRVEVIYY
ncbi:MAG: OmpA family protein [Lactobacillaceae bacterium]|jgi:outer membrane protein OmpA-like peptidoglycan-associated protein|nr:OmpA family protein [Lactobacillaceae bacterium]